MALLRWQAWYPFRELQEAQSRINRALEGAGFDKVFGGGVDFGTSTFPPLNVSVDRENVYVTAELPGMSPEDLDLSITADRLELKGERKPNGEVADEKFHRRERPHGHFNRLVSIPERVDADKIQATFKDGILTVVMPKAAEARPRQITVKPV